MKGIDTLYYICISLITTFLLLMCIALPLALIAVVPICGFLYCVPRLKSNKKLYDNSLLKEQERLNAERNRLERKVQAAVEETAIVQNKLDRVNAILNENRKLLSLLVPKMDGTVYEHYVGNLLLIEGYTEVDYTPVTGDFGADILARNPHGEKVCIQCKRYAETVGIDAVQEVAAARQYYDCDKALVITNSTFTSAAKELAYKAGVELKERYL